VRLPLELLKLAGKTKIIKLKGTGFCEEKTMKLDYVKKLYEQGLFDVFEGFDDWKDAIRAACSPLVSKGIVEKEYADSIFDNVNEYGPYIFIAPHICMPHSQRTDLVHEAAVCFVKINQTVYYDKDNDPDLAAELFFVIAVKQLNAHLDVMAELADVLDDEETVNALLQAKTKEDFKKLFEAD
jgi:PTS system ascorbate-specific IIA component